MTWKGANMEKIITLGQLKELINELPDGLLLKVTIREEPIEEGGDEHGDEAIPLQGSMDPA